MEAAICTRCQSTNPLFTKFCLICGLEITPQMRRVLTLPSSKSVKASVEVAKEDAVDSVVESIAQTPDVETSPPQKETSLWLRLLGRS
jgi:hypothetical protein